MAFLELEQVSFSYPGQKEAVLNGINLSFDQDRITALIGPNGCGKTTLTKLIIGILHPTDGEISLEGRPLSQYSLAQIGRRIGYVFQNPDQQIFCSTVREEIAFGLTHSGCSPQEIKEKVDFYLDYFELTAYQNVFPLHLSHGEKQRMVIAAVLANQPGFLILDEPTVGLDAYRKRRLAEQLNKSAGLGTGMIIVSHDTSFVERLAERIISMEKGRIDWDSRQTGDAAHET